jgi:Lon protease-like protein
MLPIFPLQYVLLPGVPLPLHIFEPRYRQLIADVTDEGSECFGIVTVRRGNETDKDVHIATVGTVADIVELEPHPDGRIDLLTVGTRRFRIVSVDTEAAYLRAEVEWLEEEFGKVDAGLLGDVRRTCRSYLTRLAGLGLRAEDDLSHDPLKLSYQVAAHLQLPLDERLRLLDQPTVAARLAAERDLLRREIALLSATRAIPVPPRVIGSVFGAS